MGPITQFLRLGAAPERGGITALLASVGTGEDEVEDAAEVTAEVATDVFALHIAPVLIPTGLLSFEPLSSVL
jgi:hypothetical protein